MKIEDIRFEGTKLIVICDEYVPLSLECKGRSIPLKKYEKAGECGGHLNIAVADDGNMMKAGSYTISAEEEMEYSYTLLKDLANRGKVFPYHGGAYAFIIVFAFERGSRKIKLKASFMMKNRHPEKERIMYPRFSVKKIFRKCGFRLLNVLYRMDHAMHSSHDRKNIMFMSENRYAISANMAAIRSRIIERKMDVDIRESYRNIFSEDYSFSSWMKLIHMIAASDVVFIDDYTPLFRELDLCDDQKLIQTWHAGFGYKRVGYARFGLNGSPNPFYSSHRKYTYGIVGCENLKDIYSESWGIPESRILATGLPRLDGFLDSIRIKETEARLYEKYPFLCGKKVILYAPTYRGYSQKKAYFNFDAIDFERLYDHLKAEDSVLVFKMHHFIKAAVPVPDEFRDRMFELSSENINDLFYIADLLITDYSSCFYDYSLLDRPMLFYIFDYPEFAATRGVTRPVEDTAPGMLCHDFDELMDALTTGAYLEYDNEPVFVDRTKEGINASDLVIDKVIGEVTAE